jgi:hypothetical protein
MVRALAEVILPSASALLARAEAEAEADRSPTTQRSPA